MPVIVEQSLAGAQDERVLWNVRAIDKELGLRLAMSMCFGAILDDYRLKVIGLGSTASM